MSDIPKILEHGIGNAGTRGKRSLRLSGCGRSDSRAA